MKQFKVVQEVNGERIERVLSTPDDVTLAQMKRYTAEAAEYANSLAGGLVSGEVREVVDLGVARSRMVRLTVDIEVADDSPLAAMGRISLPLLRAAAVTAVHSTNRKFSTMGVVAAFNKLEEVENG